MNRCSESIVFSEQVFRKSVQDQWCSEICSGTLVFSKMFWITSVHRNVQDRWCSEKCSGTLVFSEMFKITAVQ